MRSVTEIAPVGLQFVLWGYATTGDACERDAVIAEQGGGPYSGDVWDRPLSYCDTILITDPDGTQHRAPEHWCLPWVCEMRRRQEMAA